MGVLWGLLASGFRRQTESTRKRAQRLRGCGALLVSPLAWVCYLPLGYGPLLASWRRNGWTTMALAIAMTPFPFLVPQLRAPWAAAVLGSLSCIALVCWWAGTLFPESDYEGFAYLKINTIE